MPVDPLDLRNVRDKASFVRFAAALQKDWHANSDKWENGEIPAYLSAVERWTEDWKHFEKSPNPWRHAAQILWAGRIYE